uniref:ATP synthase F0 subunit F6 n=1 Tax=Tethya actinia TaxID=233783 RepID=I6LA33_TETAC|nr:ATP synthase F0 subunit 8 [Tethya actinia]AAP59067.1 ATP synthase F0 subunit F6 [Tethya actinia]
MPQLDIVTYIVQYIWVLIVLLLLFSFIVLGVLPRLQQQLALRAWAEEGLIGSNKVEDNKESESLSLLKKGLTEVFKVLCN